MSQGQNTRTGMHTHAHTCTWYRHVRTRTHAARAHTAQTCACMDTHGAGMCTPTGTHMHTQPRLVHTCSKQQGRLTRCWRKGKDEKHTELNTKSWSWQGVKSANRPTRSSGFGPDRGAAGAALEQRTRVSTRHHPEPVSSASPLPTGPQRLAIPGLPPSTQSRHCCPAGSLGSPACCHPSAVPSLAWDPPAGAVPGAPQKCGCSPHKLLGPGGGSPLWNATGGSCSPSPSWDPGAGVSGWETRGHVAVCWGPGIRARPHRPRQGHMPWAAPWSLTGAAPCPLGLDHSGGRACRWSQRYLEAPKPGPHSKCPHGCAGQT